MSGTGHSGRDVDGLHLQDVDAIGFRGLGWL